VKCLIEGNCDINLADTSKQQPILWALKLMRIEISGELIKAGCDLDVQDEEENMSPLHLCLYHEKLRPLLEKIFDRPDLNIECRTKSHGNTPLHVAILRHPVFVAQLLEKRADSNAKNKDGDFPLHIACMWGSKEAIRILLDNKRTDVNCTDQLKNTPLHVAVRRNDEEVVLWLLKKKADPVLKNCYGERPRDIIYTMGPMCNPAAPRIAKQLEDYDPGSKYWKWEIDPTALKVYDQIGVGRFGTVYSGELYGTNCAVKVVKGSPIGQIQYEIGLMGDTHHPNVVTFLGTCTKDIGQCIITEYIEGGCLSDYIASKKCANRTGRGVAWGKILTMGLDIARGMAWLHSRRPPILHRDLHSKNILVTSQEVCKVCDFGLSYVQGGAPPSNFIYHRIIPPEHKVKTEYTKAADVFMYGLILYELLTGDKGSDKNTNKQIMDTLRSEISYSPAMLVEAYDLLTLIEKCITPKPQNRPTFEEIIQWFKERLQNIDPVSAQQNALNVVPGEYV